MNTYEGRLSLWPTDFASNRKPRFTHIIGTRELNQILLGWHIYPAPINRQLQALRVEFRPPLEIDNLISQKIMAGLQCFRDRHVSTPIYQVIQAPRDRGSDGIEHRVLVS